MPELISSSARRGSENAPALSMRYYSQCRVASSLLRPQIEENEEAEEIEEKKPGNLRRLMRLPIHIIVKAYVKKRR